MDRGIAWTIAVLVGLAACSPPPRAPARMPFDGASAVVLTYNVDFEHAGAPETLGAIEASGADVVFLQEVSARWRESLRGNLLGLYPFQDYRGDDGWAAGLAVLSKRPIESVEELPRVDWFPATRNVVATPIGKLEVLNVHLRPARSESGSYVLGHFTTPAVREREIRAYAAALEGRLPGLVAGDFNEEEDGRAFRWLESHGFSDAIAPFAPEADTWSWTIGFLSIRRRWDHVLHDERLAPTFAEVRDVGRSDHRPVVAAFRPVPLP